MTHRRRHRRLAVSACFAVGAVAGQAAPTEAGPSSGVDLLLVNADVVAVDAVSTRAGAVAVDAGRIVAVGAAAELGELRGSHTAVVDAGGRAVLPGFVDPHTHSVQNQTPDLAAMLHEQRALIGGGTTTVGTPAIIPFNVSGYDELIARGLLLNRTHYYAGYNDNCGEPYDDGFWASRPFDRSADHLATFAGVKIFADGGSCGGPAVSFEYLPSAPEFLRDAGWTGGGDLFAPAVEIAEVVAASDELGAMVVIHAIGDVAIRAALDGIDHALDGRPNVNGHRIDHSSFSSLLGPDELARYGALGITPAVQLMPWAEACEPGRLEMWRATIPPEPYDVVERLDALRAANPGIRLAWHGDGPFNPGTPLQHLYSAVTTGAVDATTGEVCHPDDWADTTTIDVDEALRMITIDAAAAMQLDDEIGSIEVGKHADLVVLADDPFGPDPVTAIAANHPVATVIGGAVMFCDGAALDCAAFGAEPPLAVTDPDAAAAGAASGTAPASSSEPGATPAAAVGEGLVIAATASAEVTPASAAVDRDLDAGWMSGGAAPQWIELELAEPTAITGLRLRADQHPAGPARHRINGGAHPDPGRVLAELETDVSWGDWVTVELDGTVQWVRITTLESPSFVSWLEIELLT